MINPKLWSRAKFDIAKVVVTDGVLSFIALESCYIFIGDGTTRSISVSDWELFQFLM